MHARITARALCHQFDVQLVAFSAPVVACDEDLVLSIIDSFFILKTILNAVKATWNLVAHSNCPGSMQ